MKQFLRVLKYEMSNYFCNKVFVGVTLAGILILAAVIFFPNIKAAIAGDRSQDNEKETMLLQVDGIENGENTVMRFKMGFGNDYDVQETNESVDIIKQKIIDGQIACAFIIETPIKYTYYVENITMQDANTAIADELLRQQYIESAMISSGMTQEQVSEMMQIQIKGDAQPIGKDQSENFFYTYIMIMALYMVVVMYGQMVSMSVASEKSSRAMELLVTSVKPSSMMFGKVLAACAAGFAQLGAICGMAFLMFNINKAQWANNMLMKSIFDMPLNILVYFLIFFVFGFLVYAFLYAAVSSTVSRLEDVNTVITPIVLLLVAAFLVVLPSLFSGNMDSTLIRVCSFVPLTSPLAMFARIAMSTVAWYEIIASIAILIATVLGIGALSARIYRVGVLLYGNTPKFSDIVKLIFG